MGSKRFYDHAQNLLGGVKKEVDIIELQIQLYHTIYCNNIPFAP